MAKSGVPVQAQTRNPSGSVKSPSTNPQLGKGGPSTQRKVVQQNFATGKGKA